jgi:hypothetical protein
MRLNLACNQNLESLHKTACIKNARHKKIRRNTPATKAKRLSHHCSSLLPVLDAACPTESRFLLQSGDLQSGVRAEGISIELRLLLKMGSVAGANFVCAAGHGDGARELTSRAEHL